MQTLSVAANGLIFDGFAACDNRDPAVLLHGFPQTAHVWRHQLPALADAGYFAVALNQHGIADGARPAGKDDYRLLALVSDIFYLTYWILMHEYRPLDAVAHASVFHDDADDHPATDCLGAV